MKKYCFISKSQGKVLKILANNYPNISYSALSSALRKKDILVNGQRIKENKTLLLGDNVEFFVPDQTAKILYDILYQDDNIIVVNKQKGIEVCDGEENIQKHLQNNYPFVRAIHRIDRNTSGLVLFAKNINAYKCLVDNLKKDNIHKFYVAKVFGVPPKKQDVLYGFLVKDKNKSLVKIYDKCVENSVKIVTPYTLISTDQQTSVLEIKLVSGKTHQIRAHLAYNNLPIIGDGKYGKNEINKKYGKTKQCLTAYKIVFNLPKNCMLEYLNQTTFELTDWQL